MSQSGLERTSLLFLRTLEEILFGPEVVGKRNIMFLFGSLRVFLKAKDVEIILSSIFAAIVLKIKLNSVAILTLFDSMVLLMCKLLGCSLFVGFVLRNSFIPCHILKSFFCVLQRSF